MSFTLLAGLPLDNGVADSGSRTIIAALIVLSILALCVGIGVAMDRGSRA